MAIGGAFEPQIAFARHRHAADGRLRGGAPASASALGRRVLLVALTGWGQDEDRRRSREAGFDHHLTKPPEPDVLDQLIAERMRERDA